MSCKHLLCSLPKIVKEKADPFYIRTLNLNPFYIHILNLKPLSHQDHDNYFESYNNNNVVDYFIKYSYP